MFALKLLLERAFEGSVEWEGWRGHLYTEDRSEDVDLAYLGHLLEVGWGHAVLLGDSSRGWVRSSLLSVDALGLNTSSELARERCKPNKRSTPKGQLQTDIRKK